MNTTPDVPSEDYVLNVFPGAVKKAMETSHAKSRDLWQVPVANIRVIEGFNVRIKDDLYWEKVRSLADSMEIEGYYQDKPLAGYVARENGENLIYVTDGHRRFDAVTLIISRGVILEHLPVVVSAQGVSAEDLTVSLVRSNSGEPLRPYEQALVARRLQRFGFDSKEISRRLGFTETYVDNLLLLMSAAVEVRNMVISSHVSASTAIDALRQYGKDAAEKLREALDKAVAGGKSKLTRRHLVSQTHRVASRHGADLFQVVASINDDPAFASLKQETRDQLTSLINKITAKVDKAERREAKSAAFVPPTV